jgi:excisionase family DNA binding protein
MSTIETTNLLTVAEAAAILKLSRATAYRLIESGELPAHRIGGSIRIHEAELFESLAIRPIRVEEDTP